MKGISLFSSAGVAELYLKQIGIDIICANELLKKRADFYKEVYNGHMINGDILNENVFLEILNKAYNEKPELLIATPPCQGFSLIGKNKSTKELEDDQRNFLIFKVLELIDKSNFKYILIENVPRFLKMKYVWDGELLTIIEILNIKYSNRYIIEHEVLNAKEYGVPQSRPRAIIKIYLKNCRWSWPDKQKEIPLREVLWDIPSLESGEARQDINKWHVARKHSKNHIKWMRSTPTGQSAFDNKVNYPRKSNGEKIRGFHASYSRMSWDKPAPAVTIRSDAISSQMNVHPGHEIKKGVYSDARVLTIYELMLVSTIPLDWEIPDWASEILVRQVIGESIPPLLLKKILEKMGK